MKKLIIIFLLIANPLFAGKIEQLSWYNLQELLEDDNLTHKIINIFFINFFYLLLFITRIFFI